MAGDRVEELVGGLKNALNRGESIEMAKATFINAGYPPQIVNMAADELAFSGGSSKLSGPTVVEQKVSVPQSNLNLYATKSKPLPTTNVQVPVKQKSNFPVPYWVVILMLLLSLGIIIGAGVLGLYWHKLFPPG